MTLPPSTPQEPPFRLKVLFFYPDFGQYGGIEQVISRIAHQFRDNNAIEAVFVCSEGGALHRELAANGFRVYGVPTPVFFLPSLRRTFDLGAWWRLARIVAIEKPDIAHVHAGLIENLWFRVWGMPVVYTFHGYGTLYSNRPANGESFSPFKRLGKAVVRFLFRCTADRIDALLFVSAAEQRRVLAEGYLPSTGKKPDSHTAHANVAVLPNGVPVNEIRDHASNPAVRDALRAELGLTPQTRCITFINRLDDNKNPRHFLTMARRLAADPEWGDRVFLLVGKGPLQDELEREAVSCSTIRILGHRRDVPAILGLTDLLVYPSRREGFGLGLVEAMAAGVPCVAYASEGATDVLGGPVLSECLVPVDDQEALYETAIRLLRQAPSERERLKDALRERAGSFDAATFMARQQAVYEALFPLISIILPVFQGEATVLSAVHSVLRQTYSRFELLVVNDGSTDGTQNALQQVRDPRVRVFHRDNAGVAGARNFAFQQAQGDYIAFIDADDRWLPDKLAVEVAVLRQQGTPGQLPVCLVYGGYEAVDDADRLIHRPPVRRYAGDLSQIVLEDEGVFLPSTTLLHRRIYEAVGGFKPDCHHEDRAFFIAACQRFPAYPTGCRRVLYRQSIAGRCRSVLSDFDRALRAEQSIADTVRPVLSEAHYTYLHRLQMRNLFYRFLMYGQLAHARRLYHQFFVDSIGFSSLIQGKKGLLSRLTLKTGINFPFLTRLIVQGLSACLLSPWWSRQAAIAPTLRPVILTKIASHRLSQPETLESNSPPC